MANTYHIINSWILWTGYRFVVRFYKFQWRKNKTEFINCSCSFVWFLPRNYHLVATISVNWNKPLLVWDSWFQNLDCSYAVSQLFLKISLFNYATYSSFDPRRIHQKEPYLYLVSLKFLSKLLIHKSLHWVTLPLWIYIYKMSSKNARAEIWNLQVQNSTCCWIVGFICTGPGFVDPLFREPISSVQIRS